MDISAQRKDPPLIVALSALFCIVGGLVYISPSTAPFLVDLEREFEILDQHFVFSSLGVFCALVNFGVLAANLYQRFGFKRQGSRLRAMTKKKNESRHLNPKRFALCLSVGLVLYGLLHLLTINEELSSFIFGGEIFEFLIINIVLFIGLISYFSRSFKGIFNRKNSDHFPEMPVIPNTVAIGTTETEGEPGKTHWPLLNQKALVGNIVFTGSIGSGKSAGGIVPVVSQIIKNFSPQPSILAIDPKGTFIGNLLKILNDEVVDAADLAHEARG